MKFLIPQETTIELSASGSLRLRLVDGEVCEPVYCVPMFPISAPRTYIAVMAGNEGGGEREVGIIRDLADFDREGQRLIVNDLKLAHFLPEIRVVRSIRRTPEGDVWDVLTDRGERQFTVKAARENCGFTPEGVLIVSDEHRMRYRITAIAALDRKSQAELEKAQV